MKIQVTQETENMMLHQITSQTMQQALALTTNKYQELPSPPASKLEPQNDLDMITEEQQLKHSAAEAHKGSVSKSSDLATTHSDGSIEKKSLLSSSDEDSDDEDDDDDNMNVNLEEMEEQPVKDWVTPVQKEFLKKLTYANMKRNLQEQIRYTLRNKNHDEVCEDLVLMLTDTLNVELNGVGPEDILPQVKLEELQYALTKQARQILKTSRMMKLEKRVKRAIEKTLTAPLVQKLDEGENDFWNKLIDRYLAPITESEDHKKEVTRELKSLRNKSVFLYFIINVLWVVATFFLQAIGNDVISIKIPKYTSSGNKTGEYLKVEPLSLMFLLSFAVLLLVQFLAMLYHRVYTLIHVVSYRSTEKDYVERDDERDEDDLTVTNQYAISMTTEDL